LPGRTDFPIHLDFRLSLPEDWAQDEPRRQACHVPLEVRYQTRQAQCLEMLDTWGDQVPHGWVTGDDELGRHTPFRHALRERGERYVLGVPCNTTMRDLEAPWPAYAGRGRPLQAPWQSVTQWRQALPDDAWTHMTVRDGEKGPVAIALVKRRVQTRLERKRLGPEEWLVVTRRPLTDDGTWEARASRDATEQDERYRYHYVRRESTVEECGKHHRVYRYPTSPWSSALQTTLEGEQHAPERHHAGEASPQEVVLG
jgi:DDE superfamily endonuclease